MPQQNIILEPQEVELDRVIINDPKEIKMKGSAFKPVMSKVEYLYPNGKKGKLMVRMPEQTTSGVYPVYPFGVNVEGMTTEEKKKNISGYQLRYPATSQETMDSPTDEEQGTLHFYDVIHQAMCKKAADTSVKAMFKGQSGILKNLYNKGGKTVDPEGVKPLALHPKDKDSKEPDTTRPKGSYFRLAHTTSKQGEPVITAKVLDAANTKRVKGRIEHEVLSPSEYLETQGLVNPIITIPNVFWGSHGTTSYAASAKVQVLQMLFESADAVPQEDLFSRDAGPEDEDSDNGENGDETGESDDDGGEDGDPIGDGLGGYEDDE